MSASQLYCLSMSASPCMTIYVCLTIVLSLYGCLTVLLSLYVCLTVVCIVSLYLPHSGLSLYVCRTVCCLSILQYLSVSVLLCLPLCVLSLCCMSAVSVFRCLPLCVLSLSISAFIYVCVVSVSHMFYGQNIHRCSCHFSSFRVYPFSVNYWFSNANVHLTLRNVHVFCIINALVFSRYVLL